MKILVTGATGFVGSHLVEDLLASDCEVRILIRRPLKEYPQTWLSNGRVSVIQGDITDTSSVQGAVADADVVFHLAAQLGKWGIPEAEYNRINVHGTQVLLQECLKTGTGHFIYLSTAGVMGRLRHIPADEEHPCSPSFPYQRSKYQAELMIREAIEKKDFPATIIRPPHIYGTGDPSTVKLLRMIKQLKIFPLIGGGNSLFQPLYVADLIKVLLLCMNRRDAAVKQLYLVAGPQSMKMNEFVHLSGRIMGVKVKAVNIPFSLARVAAGVGELLGRVTHREPLLTHSRVEFLGRHQAYRTEKVQKDTGFVPEVGLSEGLTRTIEWYREKGLL